MCLEIRKWEYADGQDLVAAADNEKIAVWLTDLFPHPYTESDALSFISFCLNTPESAQMNRAVVYQGKAVGSCSLSFGTGIREGTAEIGYWLAEPFWGQGIMTEAVRLLIREGTAERELHRIEAHIISGNKRSARVLEKNGFIKEAVLRGSVRKDGAYLDEIIYALYL